MTRTPPPIVPCPWPSLLAIAALAACGRPPAPGIPGREEVGPPREAAARCTPPFPMSFGQGWFVLADLDRDRTCRVFVEQDECVVGIFRDCTDEDPQAREWQGRLTEARTLELDALPADRSGSRPPRAPLCCAGPVSPPGGATFALLECRIEDCRNPRDGRHAGLYLERDEPPARPPLAETGAVTLTPGAPVTPGREGALAVSASRGELWISLAGSAGDPGSGLFVAPTREPSAAARVDAGVARPGPLAITPDGSAVLVGDGTALVKLDAASRSERQRVELGGIVDRITAGGGEVWVGVRTADGGQVFVLDADLTPAPGATFSGRITGLVLLEGDPSRRAAVTVEGEALVVNLGAGGARERDLDLGAFPLLDLEGVVPSALTALGGTRVGFSGRCGAQAAAEGCWFEADLAQETLARVGVPGTGRLAAAAATATGEVWVSGALGALTRLETSPRRPWLGGRVTLTGAAEALALEGETLWTLDPARGRLARLAASP